VLHCFGIFFSTIWTFSNLNCPDTTQYREKWSHIHISWVLQLIVFHCQQQIAHPLNTEYKHTSKPSLCFPGLLQYLCTTDHGEHQHCNWNRYWNRAGPGVGHHSSILPVQVHKWVHQMICLSWSCKEEKEGENLLLNILWFRVFLRMCNCCMPQKSGKNFLWNFFFVKTSFYSY